MATMVLTVYGDDRAGLVDAVSEVIAEHGASWDKSYMAELAGKFAGIVSVTVPDSKVAAVSAGLEGLGASGLEIAVHSVAEVAAAQPHRELAIHLFGHDHPGIIHDLTHELTQWGASIAELATETSSAPMGGGLLFEAHLTVHAPTDLATSDMQERLEVLSDRLMVDIELIAD